MTRTRGSLAYEPGPESIQVGDDVEFTLLTNEVVNWLAGGAVLVEYGSTVDISLVGSISYIPTGLGSRQAAMKSFRSWSSHVPRRAQ